MNLRSLISTLAFAVVAASSQATILDFETHPDDFSNPMFEQGFTLTTATSGWAIVSDAWTFSPNPVRNGTVRFLMSGNGNGGVDGGQMTLTDSLSTPFSIQAFDASVMFDTPGNVNTLILIGNYNGGGTVSTTVTIDTTFRNFTLDPSWSNLDSVIFRSGTNAGFITDPGVGLDNIVVNNPVPEPATLAVIGLGLAALKRRRK